MLKKECRWIVIISFGLITSAYALNFPERFSGMTFKPLVYGQHSMVVTNNPWASKVASLILKKGGNAIDASVAAAFVLGLTEPSSSGIGGGGFALTYNQSTQHLIAYDGREIAPHSASPHLFLDAKGLPLDFSQVMLDYKSIGVPGEVALLAKMHHQQGKLTWSTLLEPAITLASQGFPMSPRLHHLLSLDRDILIRDPAVKAVYFTKLGQVKPVNTLIKNQAYATTLIALATDPTQFYTGRIAQDIISKINQLAGRDVYDLSDFKRYSPVEDKALCHSFRAYRVCTTPFSSGGSTLLELLAIYANNYSGHTFLDSNWIYHFLEASKLAFADRDQYIADPQFVPQPLAGLLSDDYLLQRSQLVTNKPMSTPVPAGVPKSIALDYAPDATFKPHGTTSLAIVDADGNAVSMTLTVEHQFGSHVFVDGFFLNNQLTDFSFLPTNKQGKPIANCVEAFKRPRSSIASTMVFNQEGELVAISGSPGGSQIICYVAKNLIHMLDFNRTPQQSSAAGNLCSVNDTPTIESDSDLMFYIQRLSARGEPVLSQTMTSGAVNIKRTPRVGWYGAADPRREGQAIGD